MKDRIELAKYFAELGFKTGVEVGVYKGAYSRELCLANPGLRLYCIDHWKIFAEREKIKRVYGKIFKYAQHKLAPFGATLIRDFSMNAVKQFADNSLDFVYIDSEHIYPEVEQDVREWAKKVRIGGIIAGHDYDIADVRKVVDEYALRHKYRLNLTDETVAISWWFVKKTTMKDRIELAKYFAELGFKTGVEVGVYAGRYSRQLLDNIPGLKLCSIDSWLGKYARHERGARQSLSKYPGSTIIKGMSVDFAKTIPDNSLDFVYIDANHSYACVMDDMTAWTPKVRSGGIVSGHDYDLVDVRKAVDEHIAKHQYKLYITDDAVSPSWWFIK